MSQSPVDVPMYPIQQDTQPKNTTALHETLQSDQAARTSAIPLPGGGLQDRRHRYSTAARAALDAKGTGDNISKAEYPILGDEEVAFTPDLVLIYVIPRHLDDTQGSQSDWTSADQQFQRLIFATRASGLQSACYQKPGDSQRRLVFLRGSESAVHVQAQLERREDWLGLNQSGAGEKVVDIPRDFSVEPLTPSERIRFTARIVQDLTQIDINDGISGRQRSSYTNVETFFPLHDQRFNANWLRQWSSVKIFIPDNQLMLIRNQFGDDVALYFDFLRHYFRWLSFPAFVGLATWLGGHYFSSLYSCSLALWSAIMIEAWRVREKKLGVRWGTYGTSGRDKSSRSTIRTAFIPERIVTSPITGKNIPYSSWYLREGRVLSTIPAIILFLLALSSAICFVFTLEVVVTEAYSGSLKRYLSFLPLIGYAGIVPQIVTLGRSFAVKLTSWENHPTHQAHSQSHVFKMFAIHAIVSYGVLALTAYAYLPFGTFLLSKLPSNVVARISPPVASGMSNRVAFSADPHRLTNTLFALMTTTQAIGAFTEVLLPYIKQEISARYLQEKDSDRKDRSPVARPDSWAGRVLAECSRPPLDLSAEYLEMVIQFGHIVLFSPAWPLAPVAALVNNFFELRGDAFKLCKTLRRSVPQRADSIGPWLDILGLLSHMGAATCASLVYMLRPRAATPIKSLGPGASVQHILQSLGNATDIKTLPDTQVRSTYLSRLENTTSSSESVQTMVLLALLCALASEQGYRLVRAVAAHITQRLFWDGSEEDTSLRAERYRLRQEMNATDRGHNVEKEIRRLQNRTTADMSDVWTPGRATDDGVA